MSSTSGHSQGLYYTIVVLGLRQGLAPVMAIASTTRDATRSLKQRPLKVLFLPIPAIRAPTHRSPPPAAVTGRFTWGDPAAREEHCKTLWAEGATSPLAMMKRSKSPT